MGAGLSGGMGSCTSKTWRRVAGIMPPLYSTARTSARWWPPVYFLCFGRWAWRAFRRLLAAVRNCLLLIFGPFLFSPTGGVERKTLSFQTRRWWHCRARREKRREGPVAARGLLLCYPKR